ncbi:hypothetical protein A1O7_05500 [Cladophialophora yegresii CBS 114405]|uniref:BTB domain-containing protein n=1 Tax=Cladophialophora yegresii CBS 114405 TaxID=1182544 RepID=W9W0P5_9EURO|nr:uncharacterized protein A1O7_05500 [Cladophialophora yegresii CBS 114405]EXJ58076.1 hypothetical protein A1O7_05500 [Cladophialophora yegresii CBS 114405]
MGTLLRYLTTGEGSDLILICNGEFFFVHRTIIAASSRFLRADACASMLFDGEAIMVNDVSPAALGKVLTFVYHGDIPDSYRKTLESNAFSHLPLHQKFPITDKFLTTVKGKPITVDLNDGTTRTTDTVTNKQKWAIMLAKQAALKDPYDMEACRGYAEVISEVDLYFAAEKLEIPALKGVAMGKVSAWFEAELQAGLPLSCDFCTCATYVLREHREFAKSFIGVCAKYLPVVEKDSALVALIEELHPMTWNAMMSVRQEWAARLRETIQDLEKSKEQLSALETRNLQQKSEAEDSKKLLKSQVETLSRYLASAKGRADTAEATVRQLESSQVSLKQELLDEKASVLKWEGANKAMQKYKPQKVDRSLQKLTEKVEDLERAVASKEEALQQSRSANRKIKDDLRYENEGLRAEIDEMKNAFNLFLAFVNYEHDCPRCGCEWNLRIGDNHYTSISIGCKRCDF